MKWLHMTGRVTHVKVKRIKSNIFIFWILDENELVFARDNILSIQKYWNGKKMKKINTTESNIFCSIQFSLKNMWNTPMQSVTFRLENFSAFCRLHKALFCSGGSLTILRIRTEKHSSFLGIHTLKIECALMGSHV